MKALPLIALVLVAAVAALLVFAATRPDTFRVQRSTSIQAPAAKIHPLIVDLRRFNTWNPYEKKDPNLTGSYRGPASGPGAGYDFHGNKDVGKGSIEIVDASAPSSVTMKLDMVEPFEGHNVVEFTLTPRGSGGHERTDVTWAMHGPSPLLAKVAGLFFSMDKMVGRDFEAGLASLKTIAEKP